MACSAMGVSQRNREIGIRVALGAQPMRVAGLVFLETGLVSVLGAGVGLAGGIGACRFIGGLVYDVKAANRAIRDRDHR